MSKLRPYSVAHTYNLPHEDYPTAHDALGEARRRNPATFARWVELSPTGKHWKVTELEPST